METPKSEFDIKLQQLIRDIVELRILADKNGKAYRAEGKLAMARSFESMANGLADNSPISVQSLAHWAEGHHETKVTGAATPEEFEANSKFLYRYLRQQGKI